MIQNKTNLSELNPTFFSVSYLYYLLPYPWVISFLRQLCLLACSGLSVSEFWYSLPHALSVFSLPLSFPIEYTSAKEVMFSLLSVGLFALLSVGLPEKRV